MLKTVRADLEDASEIMEHLVAQMPKMSREELVDLGARVRAIAKTAALIDKEVKDSIKRWRKGKPGYVLGELWKSYLALIPTTRLNQKRLEVEQPDIYAQYLETKDVERITFEAR